MKKEQISLFHAILLMVQIFVVIVGFLAQLFLFIYLISNKLDGFMITSSISILITYIAIIIYSSFGFKRNKIYYIIAIATFIIAVLINLLLPFRDVISRLLLALLFGILIVFMVRQENFKLTNFLLLAAFIISLAFSIYAAITSNINNIPNTTAKELASIMMYLSIFTPVILTGLFNVIYLVRNERIKLNN